MRKNRERDENGGEKQQQQGVGGLMRMAQALSYLLVFAAGVVIGLTATSLSHLNPITTTTTSLFISQPSSSSSSSSSPPMSFPTPPHNCLDLDTFLHPATLNHSMPDHQLFWRASLHPPLPLPLQQNQQLQYHYYPFNRTPKVAFMFLTRGPLPFLPLWERFFQGHSHLFNLYIHSPPSFSLNVSISSPFHNRNIPSQDVSWGTVTLADAERRLLANALLDFSNERFVLLSESCIPVYNFPTVYRYLTDSAHSFVESYDDPSRYGRGRYSRSMLPDIQLKHWRKGSQWFELNRALAVHLVSDTRYYSLFRKYCKPACYPDEHYIPTFLNMFHGSHNSNRTVTWVDWSMGGPHPATYGGANITVGFIQAIRNNGTLCRYNSEMTSICYLFARKFDETALEPLLNLSSQVMNF
ncbi:hypothetical protein RIF29_13802 [Crotalaria pallida]|uniref:Glycosyl transferase n=1 Tax=Crotalaria pallida TaxID=3830 RepID=A0AAN9IQ15_CROPI